MNSILHLDDYLTAEIKKTEELQYEIADLKEYVEAAKHIESGYVGCGYGGNLVDFWGEGHEIARPHVSFTTPYKSAPLVFHTLGSYQFLTHSTNIGFSAVPLDVTTEGFDVVCHVDLDWSSVSKNNNVIEGFSI